MTDRETKQVEKVFIEELHGVLRVDRCYWNDKIVTDLVETFKVRYQIGNIGLVWRKILE
jgi:fructose-1,6-bisphosphatase